MSDYLEFVSGDLHLRWGFGHTVNVYEYGREVDCFTFDWADDAPTVDRFLVLAQEYVRDIVSDCVRCGETWPVPDLLGDVCPDCRFDGAA